VALLSSGEAHLPQHGRATVVTRHPASIRRIAQALGAVGIGVNHALSPAQLPKAGPGELAVVVLDLDVDPAASPLDLVRAVADFYPEIPLVVTAGLHAKKRLMATLAHAPVRHVVPKLGGWLDLPAEQRSFDGPDEQDLAVALRRSFAPQPMPLGAQPYLIQGFSTTEAVVQSSEDKDLALGAVLELAAALELSDEKKRRIEVATEELLLNAIYDAPRDTTGKPLHSAVDRRTPVKLGSAEQVKLRYGCDGRNFVVSVADRFGALSRDDVVQSVVKLVDPRGARPTPGTSGAGLGLMLVYTAANQLVAHAVPGRFTEVTAVMHVSGSNRTALARGSALHLFVEGSSQP
jgi:anti-sigma regulatory factor (Ser/Thr protein kinase)